MSEIVPVNPFDALGSTWRFGVTPEDGRIFVVIADVAKDLGHRDAANAARMLDPEERGTHRVSTPGGAQNMLVAYEDGLWELVFLSRVDGAKAIKKRVKEILAALRRGETVGPEGPQKATVAIPSPRELALLVIAAEDRADAEKAKREIAEQRTAELEPKAAAADALMDAEGTISMGALANQYDIGRQKLFDMLREERILQKDRRPYQEYADWFRVVTKTYEDGDGIRHPYVNTRIYMSGAVRLYMLLTKRGKTLRKPAFDGQLALLPGGAA